MTNAHQNWQSLGAHGLQGTYTASGGTGFVVGRDLLDSARIGEGRVPAAEYPDGYLGTTRSRRDDRLLDSTRNRGQDRAYSRGVHKGERLDQASYFWPRGLDPQRGIRNQAMGRRTTPVTSLIESQPLTNDGKPMPKDQESVLREIDPVQASLLGALRPSWR